MGLQTLSPEELIPPDCMTPLAVTGVRTMCSPCREGWIWGSFHPVSSWCGRHGHTGQAGALESCLRWLQAAVTCSPQCLGRWLEALISTGLNTLVERRGRAPKPRQTGHLLPREMLPVDAAGIQGSRWVKQAKSLSGGSCHLSASGNIHLANGVKDILWAPVKLLQNLMGFRWEMFRLGQP